MEKFEARPTNEEFLEQYDVKFSDKENVALEDLAEMKEKGVSTEMFLDYLVKKHGVLLHGSRNKILNEDGIVASGREKVFATNNAGVAIIKAIISAKGLKNLGYHLSNLDNQKVTIEGEVTPENIGEKGYVYVVDDSQGFSNEGTQGQAEFVKAVKKGGTLPFSKSVEVERKDLNYQIEFKE